VVLGLTPVTRLTHAESGKPGKQDDKMKPSSLISVYKCDPKDQTSPTT
jgi:hypothetical protein